MYCASARCRRATGPFISAKRVPDSLTAVSKSSPSAAPTSTWSRTAKSKTRGVPTRRTSTLSLSDVPAGVRACGRFGIPCRKDIRSACTRASRTSSAFCVSGIAATSAITAVASSPRLFSCPICFDSAFRVACSDSVAVCTRFRSDSSDSNASRSNA